MVIFNNDTQTEQEEEISEHQAAMVMAAMAGAPEGPEPNTLGLVGDLNEESAQELYHGLMQLNGGKVFPNPVGEGEERPEDVHLLISTGGGAVYDMFGIIDIMNIVKRRRDIATLGTGKVFSAGVPLLASDRDWETRR